MDEVQEVTYSTNNSGGNFWLSDQDWINLENAGWEVEWIKDQTGRSGVKNDRFMAALATSAIRRGLSERMAIAEWQDIVGQDPDEEGCPCCGGPHSFY